MVRHSQGIGNGERYKRLANALRTLQMLPNALPTLLMACECLRKFSQHSLKFRRRFLNLPIFVSRWRMTCSSTFRPHPGRVIRDLFRQLHAVKHGTKALVYSNHSREAAASSYLAIIFGRIASGVPCFLRSTAVPMQLSHQCRRWCRPW